MVSTTRMPFQDAASRIKQGLDILDVVGRYVSLRRAGRSYTGLCPFHKEKTPSFNVHPEKQLYKCFGCGEGGDAIQFLMTMEHKTYGELIMTLAEDQGIEIERDGKPQPSRDELDTLLHMHQVAQKFYAERLQQAPDVLTYLADRHLSPAWQQHFGLGFAPDGWENLTRVLNQELPEVRQSPMLLEKSGLANLRTEGQGYYDRFRGRLMVPIHDDRGRVVAFGGRALKPDDQPKYLNSAETPIYVKSRLLYGFHWAKEAVRESRYAVLMEGYFDVMAAQMAGVFQAVGVCGTALTEGHLKMLQRAGAETLFLCFDTDSAGQNATLRAIDLVQQQAIDHGLSIKVVQLPDGKDPADYFGRHTHADFQAELNRAMDFLSFKCRKVLESVADTTTPEGRIKAVQAITPILLDIRQPVLRQEYVRQMAERLGLAEETLMLELKRMEKSNGLYQNKKNYMDEAISATRPPYKEKKNGYKKPPVRKRFEDMTAYRQHLSQRLPLEQKEHLLLSYLFVNDESYVLVMTVLETLDLQSPPAKALVDLVRAVRNTWETLDELADRLAERLYDTGDKALMAFLADRRLEATQLEDTAPPANGKGISAPEQQETRVRVIHDIVERIRFLRTRDSEKTLAVTARQHEVKDEDTDAYEMQLKLRAALAARKRPQLASPANEIGVSLDEAQGV